MDKKLEKEFDYFLEHHEELVKKYNNKFVVIKNCAVIGAYNTELEAIEETSKEHEVGTFIVQLCSPGSDSYSATYHSRVAF